MIPLGTWLTEEAKGPDPVEPFPQAAAEVGIGETDHEADRLQEAFLHGKAEALAEAEARIEAAVATARSEAELQADARIRHWTASVGSDIAGAVRAAVDNMQRSIECSVLDVLRPFVGDRTATRSVEALNQLIRLEIERSPDPPLELLAPAVLADALRDAFAERALAIQVLEGSIVELKFKSHAARFQSMTSEWSRILESDHDV